MAELVRIENAERRARLVNRHHLGRTAQDAHEAVKSVIALHSSDPATPHLGARARVQGFSPGDLDEALLEKRALWRLHAMRRTLFIVSVDDAPMVEAAAGREVAARERRKLEGWLAQEVPATEVPTLLARLEGEVLELLGDGAELLTGEVRSAIPDLDLQITIGSGKWKTRVPLSSRLLFLMALDGHLVRTRPAGSWVSSQYRWASASAWWATKAEPRDPLQARTELARRYLTAFGPATHEDLRWWAGWTVKQTRAALRESAALSVRLEGGEEGLLLPGDLDAPQEGQDLPVVTLLPALDPTPMGWKHRDWFLGPHASKLFDRSGNIGPSVWLGGRVIGGWAQQPGGKVVVRLIEDVGMEAGRRVEEEAEDLTAWMDGAVVTPRFRTPLESELSAAS